VGKSLITAALCRIFAQEGYRVAPFKSQNMSLNSAVTPDGLEIGRAQALQAEAAGILPSVHMNPILLKPSGDMTSQIIVRGKIWGRLNAADYHLRRVEELLPIVRESYEVLASQNDVIVLEGAGSPAEINLKQHDIVNMRMAEMSDAVCLLVGDIDRGGVFASLLGTVELLEDYERNRIYGFLINKFRGDISLLEPGIRMIAKRLKKTCIGVVPYLHNLMLDEEDSLGLPPDSPEACTWSATGDRGRPLRIAVIALPSFSNFTDFDALRAEPSVSLRFCRNSDQLNNADIVMIPGSKQTADDLNWLRLQHLDTAILTHAREGLLVGICGGMQMLGEEILDPHEVESAGVIRGLGLLPIQTTMKPTKLTRISSGALAESSIFGQGVLPLRITGYEIHVGETRYLEGAKPFARIETEGSAGQLLDDGCVASHGRVFGSYLHGLFDDDNFRHNYIAAARAFHNLLPAVQENNWKQERESSLNRLSDAVRASLDMAEIFSWAGHTYQSNLRTAAKVHI
jgi:adenosylcobyric acid synthase